MYVLGVWNLLLKSHRQSVCTCKSAKPGVSSVLSAFPQFKGLAQVTETLTFEQPRPGGLEVEEVRRVSASGVPRALGPRNDLLSAQQCCAGGQ